MVSCNNDRTVFGKTYAWRPLGMMPAISKEATVAQTSEWRAERRTWLYHTGIDILVEQINDLTGRDIHIRYADKLVRHSCVFMDSLSMDCDEVSTITMCPTTQCASCWCPRDQLQDMTRCSPSETRGIRGNFTLRCKQSERDCSIKMERHVKGARTG